MQQLKDKIFIITGATSGMGREIAVRFAGEGASVVLSGRNQERGQEVEKEIKNQNGRALFLAGDVADPSYNEQLVDTAIDNFGKLNGVVTNAGILGLGSVTELSLEDWDQTFKTNISSVFYLLKYAIPEIVKNDEGVTIVNASIAAFKSFPNHAAYCASKAGLVALVKQVAVDYGPKIRINSICPGPVDTPMIWDSAKAFPDPEEAVNQAADATLMKRLGTPKDVADLALFLATESSGWITGSSFNIDGGIMARG
ncbi:MAG: NAD(P)-dependent dehydrogenase (short-subunit alcohol dehydrogenase family) [Cyclobacteriaceae bacterium]|jgi:NAD(P)-dependent dehydrogenase (short-subunit alcohol dehydrogenase family)